MAQAFEGFNAADFRAGIRLVMQGGLPPNTEDQPTFVFPTQVQNTTPADEHGVPFNPAARPVVPPPEQIRVPCAIEYQDVNGKVENVGVVVPSIVKITLLDDEYEQVKGFEYVVIAGDKFYYRFTEPPVGLDVVGVWTIECVAEDDV